MNDNLPCSIIMLPTKKEPQTGQIGLNSYGGLIIIGDEYPVDKERFVPQNMYLTSKRKINPGDWMAVFSVGMKDRENGGYVGRGWSICQHKDTPASRLAAICQGTVKVEATTDFLELPRISEFSSAINYVPLIPKSFIEEYMKRNNDSFISVSSTRKKKVKKIEKVWLQMATKCYCGHTSVCDCAEAPPKEYIRMVYANCDKQVTVHLTKNGYTSI